MKDKKVNKRETFWGAESPDLQCKNFILFFRICLQRKYSSHTSGHIVCFSFLHVISGIIFVFLWVLPLKVKGWKSLSFPKSRFLTQNVRQIPCFILILCGSLVTAWNVCKALTLEWELPSLAQYPVLSEKKNQRQRKHTVYSSYTDFLQPGEADSSSNIDTYLIKAPFLLLHSLQC